MAALRLIISQNFIFVIELDQKCSYRIDIRTKNVVVVVFFAFVLTFIYKKVNGGKNINFGLFRFVLNFTGASSVSRSLNNTLR